MSWPLMQNAITFIDRLKLIWFILITDRFTNGEKVKEFENKWSEWLGCKHSLFVSSGSTANSLLVSAIIEKYNLKRGDKVIVPACTWITNVSPLIQLGLTPVFCDINTKNYSFDDVHFKRLVNKHNIKAVFVTHLLGLAADIERYKEIAADAIFIEDCCESHGATVGNKKIGTLSEGSTFSFYFGHHMTTIEGGMVSTDDVELYQIMKSKRSHGMVRELPDDVVNQYKEKYPNIDYRFMFITDGYNFRNTELGAVIGLSQLKRLDNIIDKRRNNFDKYLSIISKYKCFYKPNETGNSSFCLPFVSDDIGYIKKLKKIMEDNNIETRPIVSGNLLKQPFLRDYKLDIKNPTIDIIDKGFYIGNNHFLDNCQFKILERLIDENTII